MTPSAAEALIDQVSGPVHALEMTPAYAGVDLRHFFINLVRTKAHDFDIAGSITDGYVERAIDAASTVSVTFHDPRGVLLNADIWDFAIDVDLSGYVFRLVGVSKDGDDITLTFEDRVVTWMRYHTDPLKISRNKMTRAEFIKHMVDEIKADNRGWVPLEFFAPELHKKQPIRKPKKIKTRRKNKEPGLHKDISIEDPQSHTELTTEQKSNLERVLDVGYSMKAPRLVQIATVMCIYQESRLLTGATNGTHVGLFQQDPRYWPATRNPEKDARAWYKAAIAKYKASPGTISDDADPALLIESVQASGQPSAYSPWLTFAQKVVKEYTGQDSAAPEVGSYTRTYAKSYQFTRGQPDGPRGENTYQAAMRLADQVRWRFFVVGNVVYYVNDHDLLQAKPIMVIDGDDEGIIQIDYDHDVGKRTAEATVTCRAEKWFAHPGEVVTLKDSMGPARGRWLVLRIHRPFFDETTEVTLYRPQKSLKEPAHELTQVTKERTQGSVDAGTLFDICKKFKGQYLYGGAHGRNLDEVGYSDPMDCSSSVSLALHKADLFEPSFAWVSGDFAARYGDAGRGDEFTIWAHSGHVFLEFEGKEHAGWRFDTSPRSTDRPNGYGPRLRKGERDHSGFIPRHLPGH